MTIRKSLVLLATAVLFVIGGCSSTSNVVAVQPFDLDRYLGKWYEIVRTDNSFQRGTINATATYTLKDNGTVKVVNRAYEVADDEWDVATGTAKFVESRAVGKLKVAFFWPFYGAYNVVAIDEDYQNVLVMGDSPKYMWILSRQKTVSEAVKKDYLQRAKTLGVDIDALIWNAPNTLE